MSDSNKVIPWDVCILNTGGTFSQSKNREGVYDIIPNHMDQVNEQIMVFTKSYFPDLQCGIVPIIDPKLNFIWEKFNATPQYLDSSAMTANYWNVMAGAISYLHSENIAKSFVIIHGTDSLAYSAAALSFMIRDCSYPIIVTGAQVPILSKSTDAIRNLIEAITVATHKTTAGHMNGVYVSFYGKLMRGVHVVKVSSIELEAFDAPRFQPVGTINFTNLKIDPRYIGQLGYLEYIVRKKQEAKLKDSTSTKQHLTTQPNTTNNTNICDSISNTSNTNKSYNNKIFRACDCIGAVMIIKIYPGIDINYLLTIPKESRPRAILLIGLGSGNGPSNDMNNTLKTLLNEYCFIAVVSDCLDGRASERYATSIVVRNFIKTLLFTMYNPI